MFDCSFVVLGQTAFASRLAPTLDNCTRQKLVGCQTAIAGKPAPTGLCAVCKNWSAIRPPSLASQLPQDCVQSARTGRHSGRLRWQASSHRDCVQSARTGRLSGRHRWQACFHRIACVCKNWSAVRPPSLASQLPQSLRAVCKNWSALRPPSLASLLPQDCAQSARTGRLSGRHRQQAGSHRKQKQPASASHHSTR